jgi:hypothetical protein
VLVLSAPDERALGKILRQVDRALFSALKRAPGSELDRLSRPLLHRKIHAHTDWTGASR